MVDLFSYLDDTNWKNWFDSSLVNGRYQISSTNHHTLWKMQVKGILMIRMEDMGRVVSYLEEKGAKVSKWEVIPRSEEKKQLELQAT